MSTYDPVNPDPIHRIKPRREKTAAWLAALPILFGILAWTVDLSRAVLISMAVCSVVVILVMAGLLLWPAQRAEVREEEHGEEYPS
jgi:Mn2+/Fe2+ NRAMP family transporter